MLKARWRLNVRKKAPWASIIRSKYKCGREEGIQVDTSKQGSNFWRGICKTGRDFDDNIVWRIGNGCQINLWLDTWVLSQGKLIDKALHYVDEGCLQSRVVDFVNQQGAWD